MVEYKLVKYCIRCKVRFTLNRGEPKRNYCVTCKENIAREREEAKKASEE